MGIVPWALGKRKDGPNWVDQQMLLPCPRALGTSPSLTGGSQLRRGAQPAPQNVLPVPPSAPRAHPHCSGGVSVHPSPVMPGAGMCPCVTHVCGAVCAHECPREVGVHTAVRGPGGALPRGAISQPVLMQFSNQNNLADEYLSRALNI